MKSIFFVPVGGLGNRMRAVASAVSLARKLGVTVHIGWFKDWALNAEFSSLFELPDVPGVKISDVPSVLYWALDRPRKKNLFIPRVFQSLMFGQCLYENEMGELFSRKTDFMSYDFKTSRSLYMASFHPFFGYDKELFNSLFLPNEQIRKKINDRCSEFSDYTIGVHVRRTDNILSVNESPIELFYEYIDDELKNHNGMTIYLATDSESVKRDFRNRYGNLVITSDNEADRGSVKGIQDGIVDLYTLSETSRIYGSYGSSFSELAAEIGGIPLTIVRK